VDAEISETLVFNSTLTWVIVQKVLLHLHGMQCYLLASCGIKILEVSAVAVYNFKAQASLHHVF
jgi:hypothetical protein